MLPSTLDKNLHSAKKSFRTETIRKAWEAVIIQKGTTIDPDGLNIREETYFNMF